MVEAGLLGELDGQVAEVGGGWFLQVQFAQSFLLAEPVELNGDDSGGLLVSGPGELGVNFKVVDPSAWPSLPATIFKLTPASRSWVAE